MKTNTKTNMETAWRKAPSWVRREINRLEKMADAGGSGSAIEFNRQAKLLKEKYILPFAHGGL